MDTMGEMHRRKLITASFVTPGGTGVDISKLEIENPDFRQGQLLQTIEKGVKYPVVHLGPVNYYFGWEHGDPKSSRRRVLSDKTKVEQGLYQELATVRVDLFGTAYDNVNGITNDVNWSKFYLILGFKQLPFRAFTETTEIHWKDWSLARYLFLNMPDDFGLSALTFYKRHQPDEFSLFMYMVVVECAHIRPRDQLQLSDFVNRIRADKLPSFMALYRSAKDKSPLNLTTPLLSSTPIPTVKMEHRHQIIRESPSSYEHRIVRENTCTPEPLRTPRTPSPFFLRERSPSPTSVSNRQQRTTRSRGTSPLGQPWFFMSHPQFLRRNQRLLQRDGDLDSVGESEDRYNSSRSYSPSGRSTSSPIPYYYQWPLQSSIYDQF